MIMIIKKFVNLSSGKYLNHKSNDVNKNNKYNNLFSKLK